MPQALRIVAFEEVDSPILEPVTKFGGQPVWLEKPCWPIFLETGAKVPFFAQIALEPDLFGDIAAKMAYIFYSDQSEDPTESFTVLQPGAYGGPFVSESEGPTLVKVVDSADPPYWKGASTECRVTLTPQEDSEYVPFPPFSFESAAEDEESGDSSSDDADGEDFESMGEHVGHKVGGTPNLWEDQFMPEGGMTEWSLLLQMESEDETELKPPFCVGYGDGGCGWWFLSKDGLRTMFTSVCH